MAEVNPRPAVYELVVSELVVSEGGKAITQLAQVAPSWCDQLRLIDTTPIPCGTSRETVTRSNLAGHAGYGYSAAHSRFYWGYKLVCHSECASTENLPARIVRSTSTSSAAERRPNSACTS